MKDRVIEIELETIGQGIPVIPEEAAGFYKQNCIVCFAENSHVSGVIMAVEGEEHLLRLTWTSSVNKQLRRAYGDQNKAVDHAACALALLMVRELTEYTAVEQSNLGTTIDYYLSKSDPDETLIFNQYDARLEVSGIFKANEGNSLNSRLNEKIRRLKKDRIYGTTDHVIIVVDFGKPSSLMKSDIRI